MSTFSLRIVTPDRDVFSGTVDYVSLDTQDGRVGFLRGALPRVAVLKEGLIEVTIGKEKISYYSSDGVYNITKNGMTISLSDCYDISEGQKEEATDEQSRRNLDYAKARIASSMMKMKGKKSAD